MVWHWICGLGRDWWIGYGLVDWSGICIGVAYWSKIGFTLIKQRLVDGLELDWHFGPGLVDYYWI